MNDRTGGGIKKVMYDVIGLRVVKVLYWEGALPLFFLLLFHNYFSYTGK